MHKLNQQGSLLVPLILSVTLLICAIGFGFWAFAGRQDYKNNVDTKIADAVKVAEEKLTVVKDAEYAEKEKSPYKSYQGPLTYGSIGFNYPKSWSAFIDESQSGSTVITGFFYPDFVPADAGAYALRFEVVNTTYDNVLKSFESSEKSGKVKVSAYRAPKVDSILGSRLEGDLGNKKQGVMVVLPLRDKSIKVWTEGQEFQSDYNEILNNFSFVP